MSKSSRLISNATTIKADMRWYLWLLSTLAYTVNVIEGICPTPVRVVSINETAPPGTYITTAEKCLGLGPYSLSGDDKDLFQINSTTGVITAKRPLDSEISRVLRFDIVDDACQPSSSCFPFRIYVQVNDLNDNVPEFMNLPYDVNVSEATGVKTVVFSVPVIDRDTAIGPYGEANNAATFDIVGGNINGTFSVNSSRLENVGDIILEKPLDFEGPNRIYNLNVTATDKYGEGNQNWTIVTIRVLNEDDNQLTFQQIVYEVLVTGDAFKKGLEVAKVQAEDKDLDPLYYGIYPGSDQDNKFTINNMTGIISMNKELSRGSYYLIAMAEPLALSSRTFPALSLVIVHVGSKPNQTYKASVMENKANILVLNLERVEQYFNVTNPVFSILPSSDGNKFVIDQATKELRVGGQGLDREENAQLVLVVEVQSSRINRGFAMVVVDVLDMNDNSPHFQSRLFVSAREDASVGTVVYTAVATDADVAQNGTVAYEIVGGNEQGFFTLNNKSGALSLSSPLDYEITRQYMLNISASDLGQPRLRSFIDVTINVTDVNDNSPVLNPRSVRVSLPEETAPGSYVTQLTATDADSAANGNITYYVVEGGANKFIIDNHSGIVTTTGPFDRESGVNEYVLVIKAQDNGPHPRADIGFVTVSIANTNKHSPVISPSSYIGGVYKETTYFSLVTTVKATDDDFDPNAVISHYVVGGDGVEMFHVEPDTGHVRVACSLANKIGSKYTLQVRASDGVKASDPATVDVFLLQNEDSVILTTSVNPMEITRKRQEFVGMLEAITGGKAFIKHLVREDVTNSTLVTFHVVKNKTVMSGSEILSYLSVNRELLDTTYEQWKIQGYQTYQPPVQVLPEARKADNGGKISAVAGAMICLGVLVGVIAIIMLIVLIRRKQTGKSPFKKKRRVRFNDNPFYIFPNPNAVVRNQVESAQEAQEVIIHLPSEDNNSLEGSEGSGEVIMNFGAAARMAAISEKDPDELVDVENQQYFFPPPPMGPPPPPPDSDSEYESNTSESDSDEDTANVIADASAVFKSEFVKDELDPETYRSDDEGDFVGIVLNGSPSDSTTGILNDQFVSAGFKVASSDGSFLQRFSLNESKTDL